MGLNSAFKRLAAVTHTLHLPLSFKPCTGHTFMPCCLHIIKRRSASLRNTRCSKVWIAILLFSCLAMHF